MNVELTASSTAAPPRQGRRWLTLVAMTGALSLIMLDQTVVTVALPTMSAHLPLSPELVPWVVNAYVLAMASFVAIGGKLSDKLGRPTTFRIGILLFILASAGCALVPAGPDAGYLLIACRALQGLGAAVMMPASAVLVIDAFPPSMSGRVMALYAGISQIFLALGPLIGGYLTDYVSWRAVFFLSVPVGLLSLLLLAIAKPATGRRPSRLHGLDVLLIVSGLGLTTFAVQQTANWGWTSSRTLTLLGVGVEIIAVFAIRQLRVADPLVDLRLLGNRGFLGDSTVMFLVQFALLGIVLYSSIYSQELLGFDPMTAGLSSLPLILPIMITSQIGGKWFDRAGVRPPVITGLLLCCAGAAAWVIALPLLDYPWQVPGMVLVGIGLGLTMSPTNTDGLVRAGQDRRSQASGLIQTVRQVGGTFGVAVIGSVVLARMPSGATSHATAADAIQAGFVVAAAVLGAAALAAMLLLAGRPRAAGGH
jgi:EmrB/QacA subfamily drug resistance transporter